MKGITVLIGFIFLFAANVLFAQSNTKSNISGDVDIGLADVVGNAHADTISLKQHKQSGIAVYPSPAKDDINVQFEIRQATTIRMSNILGNVLYETTTTSNPRLYSTTIDIGSLPRGLYFITIDDGTDAQTKRFVKQ